MHELAGQVLATVVEREALELTTAEGWYVVIENDCELHLFDGTVLTTCTGDEERIVAVLRAELGTPLTSFAYTEEGHLAFAIAAGEVRVAPSRRFESWHLVGPRRERVIATPGGELAIWSAWE